MLGIVKTQSMIGIVKAQNTVIIPDSNACFAVIVEVYL